MNSPLGHRQSQMLDFISRHGEHRSYSIHPDENRVALSLQRRGLIKVYDCGMATNRGRRVLMVTGAN